MKKILSLLLVTLMWSSLVSAQVAIRFGIIDFYPPFAFSTKTGYLHGFDVDVAKSICEQLNAQCTFTAMPLMQLFASLNNKQVDAIIGAISITPERLSVFTFTHPYLKSTMSFLILADSQTQPDNILGKKVGVVKGSIFHDYLAKKYGSNIKLMDYNTNEALMMALSNKDIDLVLIDTPAAKYWVNYSMGLFKTLGQPAFLSSDQGYGIGLKKDNPLVNSLNSALAAMNKKGKIEQLKHAHFVPQ